MGNQGFGQATALGATETGGPGQWASPTTGAGTNVVGVQGMMGNPRLAPPTGLPPVGVQPIAPGTGLVTALCKPKNVQSEINFVRELLTISGVNKLYLSYTTHVLIQFI